LNLIVIVQSDLRFWLTCGADILSASSGGILPPGARARMPRNPAGWEACPTCFSRRDHGFALSVPFAATFVSLAFFGGTMRRTPPDAMLCGMDSESFFTSTLQKSALCDPSEIFGSMFN